MSSFKEDANKSGISASNSEFDVSIAPSNNPSEKERSGYAHSKIEQHQGLPDIKQPETIDVQQVPEIKKNFSTSIKYNCCKCLFNSGSHIEKIFEEAPLFNLGDDLDPASDTFEAQQTAALKLSIKGTGILEMDEYVLHPFVRIHIMDRTTSKYLHKSDPDKPGVANKESANFMQMKEKQAEVGKASGETTKQMTNVDTNFLLPMSTKMNDLRINGVNYCNWDEDFVINEYAKNIYSPDTIILFEILDFSERLLFNGSKKLTPDNLYPVAWAYLRPLGTANIHMGTRKLQLFHYLHKGDKGMKYNRCVDPRTPDVYLELDWPLRRKYSSFLEIELQFSNKYDMDIEREHISRAPWEREVGKNDGKLEQTKGGKAKQAILMNIEDNPEVRKKTEHWEKYDQVESMLPNRLVQKFESEAQGCLRVKFSHSGKYLACACTMSKPASKSYSNNKTVIKIFDCEDGNLQVILSGHRDLIHDLCWSYDDQYLVSASADSSVRVWSLKFIERDWSDKLNFHNNDKAYFVTEILHPSFVYGAKIHPNARDSPDHLYIATICFDQWVRIIHVEFDSSQPTEQSTTYQDVAHKMNINGDVSFTLGGKKSAFDAPENLEDDMLRLIMNPQDDVLGGKVGAVNSSVGDSKQSSQTKRQAREQDLQKYKQIVEQKHPSAIVFDEGSNQLFVGDSQGQINVWRVRVASGEVYVVDPFKIKQKEIEGDQINEIIVHPDCKNQLYVQSRDNCIRLIDYETGSGVKIKKRFFGAKCSKQMVQSTLSPDGRYLVSGSETGKPYIWDEFEQLQDTDTLECNFGDLVSDCDWNPRYNMFALSGFGQGFPVLIYAYVRSTKEFEDLMMAVQRQGGRLQTAILPDMNHEKNQELVDKMADQTNVSQSEYSSPKKQQPRARSEGRFGSTGKSSDMGFTR